MRAVYLKDKTGNRVVTTPYYRIGDLFLTTIATNPSSYLGGKWELFGPGRCLVCVDTSQIEFNSVKKTGGSKNHRHIGTSAFAVISGNRYVGITNTDGFINESVTQFYGAQVVVNGQSTTSSVDSARYYTRYADNIQPFITCYVWIRTA